ncbi:MAG TPA: DUF711 family protein [Promineifilum sp.]|nr:DUF711 family protein [Promineifilum sp.]
MEIRSVTLFCDAGRSPAVYAPFLKAARGAFPVRVQSMRLGTTPFPDWLPRRDAARAAALAEAWRAAGVDYVSLGPVQLRHDPAWLAVIPDLLADTDGVFASIEIATTDGHIDTGRCRDAAEIIRRVSTLRPDGFANLFLGALAACGPGHPFLPASYAGGADTFAIAVEAADVALTAVNGAATLTEAAGRLTAGIEAAAAAIVPVAQRLSAEFNLPFGGLDFSLAPYPTPDKSLGAALEALGTRVGAPGALFAAAFITAAIDRAAFPRTGFSGLMLPVLEDATLARRAAAGQLALNDLLLYSAVCGVGLDTIPLPGDIGAATLAGILLDTAALAARLRKPLVARLMPLPGHRAGDETAFSFEYFAPGRAMTVSGEGVGGLLGGRTALALAANRTR